MTRKLLILTLVLAIALPLRAQKADRVETLRKTFITRQVPISDAEGEKFWPVYNEYHIKLRVIKKSIRQMHRRYSESMSEEEVKTLAARELEWREREAVIHRSYSEKIIAIIGQRKYMRLRVAEEEFRREMIKTLRSREE